MLVHQRQHPETARPQIGIDLAVRLLQKEFLEAQHRDRGLVAVLFPEQPLIHQRPFESIGRDQVGVLGQMQHDGVGLGQHAAVGEAHDRHLSGRVHRQKFRRAGLLVDDADLDPVVRKAQPVGDELHLQAIARDGIAIDRHRGVIQRHVLSSGGQASQYFRTPVLLKREAGRVRCARSLRCGLPPPRWRHLPPPPAPAARRADGCPLHCSSPA